MEESSSLSDSEVSLLSHYIRGQGSTDELLAVVPLERLVGLLSQPTASRELLIKVVTRIFQTPSKALVFTPSILQHLRTGLRCHDEPLRRCAAQALLFGLVSIRVEGSSSDLAGLLVSEGLVCDLCVCVGDPSSIGVSSLASDCLVKLLEVLQSASRFTLESVVLEIYRAAKASAADNAVVALRFAEVITRILPISGEVSRVATTTGLVDVLFDMVTSTSDPLLQYASMDLVESLAAVAPKVLLFERGYITRLLNLIDLEGQPDPICAGGIRVLSKLFDSMVLVSPDDAGKIDPEDLGRIFDVCIVRQTTLEYTSEVKRLALLSALTHVCSTHKGLNMVLQNKRLLEFFLDVRQLKGELKGATFSSLGQILRVRRGGDDDDVLLPRLYHALGLANGAESTAALCLSYAQRPIPAVRCPSYDLLVAVAVRGEWGIRALFAEPAFAGFLLERADNRGKSESEWHYSLVEACLNSGIDILPEPILQGCRAYLAGGVFLPTRSRELETM